MIKIDAGIHAADILFPGIGFVQEKILIYGKLDTFGPLISNPGEFTGFPIIDGIAVPDCVGETESIAPEGKLINDFVGFLAYIL